MTTSQRGHRLERLFSKRRSANSTKTCDKGESSGPVFPQASFIRPTSSRMMAREEGASRTPSPRSQTYKHHRSSLPLSIGSSNTSSFQEEPTLGQSAAIASNLPDLKVLRHVNQATHFGETPAAHSSTPASARVSGTFISAKPAVRPGSSPPLAVLRLDTPPASDAEDSFSRALEKFKFSNHTRSHNSLPHNIPTPGQSPEMSPILDLNMKDQPTRIKGLGGARTSTDSFEYTTKDLLDHRPKTLAPNLHKKGSSTLAVYKPVLKEPTFHDFMDLSDDDIAEDHPDGTPGTAANMKALPPSPPSTASSSLLSASRSRAASLLTLPPPYTSRPATAAAFEAARIASRYNFDLVYVVNLWPDWNLRQDPGSITPTLSSSRAQISGGNNMTGRLLAAYGLSAVKSPFRISAAVHTKILQTDGWIEYRNEEAQKNEFARGYACAFYKGEYGRRRGSADSSSTTATGMSSNGNIDRGIVFAAYRKPSPGGDDSAVSCSKSELAVIYKDAEALVEMLIDIHMANRLRHSTAHGLHVHSDETGPMPIHRPTEITLG